MRSKGYFLVVSSLFVGALPGCAVGTSEASGAHEDTASVEVALTSTAPASVQCIKVVVTVAGQAAPAVLLNVTPGQQQTNLSIGQFAAGAATFQGWAYNATCANVTSSTVANWVADSASATLVPGFVSAIALNFKQNNSVAVNANFAANVAEVYTSVYATFARLGDGSVMQWGSTPVFGTWVPTPVASLTNVAQVAGGNGFACARKTDGTVWCWGNNAAGAMGPSVALGGFTANPVQIPGLSSVSAITAGESHVCAITNGNLYCWGAGSDGQLGNGATNNVTTPVFVRAYVSSASAGSFHTCLTDSIVGNVMCTGRNTNGQLGNGTTANSSSFVWPGLAGAVAVAAGPYHSCALLADNQVRCFGYNGYGQLGDGTFTSRLSPVLVGGLSSVQQIQVGSLHTCALQQNGNVSCWGNAPKLGTGQTTDQPSPQLVPGLSNVLAVHTTQGDHTCVELADHSVKCWGSNAYGQIGDGTFKFAPRPLLIQF